MLVLLLATSCCCSARAERPWDDAALPVDRRISLLLEQLTDAEKGAQLSYHTQGGDPDEDGAQCAAAGGCGGLRCDAKTYWNASACVDWANGVQRALRAKARVFVPVTFFCETTHAGGIQGSTIFPMPVALGQSWNTSLMEAVGSQIGVQARASGCSQAMSPLLQVATDPRWGRLAENVGEDWHLVSEFGLASMRGIMGAENVGPQHNASTYLSDPELHPWCQAKHYAGYGSFPRDSFTSSAQTGEASLMEIYLRPWLAFASNGGRGVMASHNMLQSEPMHASHHWLTDVLRHRLGLGGGYIGSDNGNVGDLYSKYGVAASNADAAALWLESGGDQAMTRLPSDDNRPANVSQLIADGLLSRTALDRAAANVLRVKFASGIFDAPFTSRDHLKRVDSEAARRLARAAAAEGVVLLTNHAAMGRGAMLPLPAGLRSVAVLGALGGCDPSVAPPIEGPPDLCLARMAFAGGYSDGYGDSTYKFLQIDTLAEALEKTGARVTVVPGGAPDVPADPARISAALESARSAEVVVLVIGDSACSHIGRCTCGEAADRISLDAPGGQLRLLEAVLADNATLSRTVLVHIGGRPLTFPNNSESAKAFPAIVTAMVPGEEGAAAIVSVLTGEVAPSGRLTQTWVRQVGYVRTNSHPHYQFPALTTHDWRDVAPGTASALFEFGHGLSYTQWQFSKLRVTAPGADATKEDAVGVEIDVANTGGVASAVTVQVYCSFLDAPRLRIVRFAQTLCGFTKVFVEPKQQTTAAVSVTLSSLARYDPRASSVDLLGRTVPGAYTIDAGRWAVAVGDCSGAGEAAGYASPLPCERQRAPFNISRTISFCGKQ